MLGRYRIISLLGEGGFGKVYEARDTNLRRIVALKILPTHSEDEDDLLRFRQEAYAASALNHPNIITVFDVGQVGQTYFHVTEFVEGITLRARMSRQQPPIKQGEALGIAVQLADALAAAHEQGIVHRDIKPENIMLGRSGQVKVLDFGVAKFTGQEELVPDSQRRNVVRTKRDMLLGTTKYMSPEQHEGEDVDGRSDIWSVGVVIYEMIAGVTPFDGPTPNAIIKNVLGDHSPLPLPRYSHEVSDELERIVAKALRKDREDRYQTIKEMLIDLRVLKRDLDIHGARPTRFAPLPQPQPTPQPTPQPSPGPASPPAGGGGGPEAESDPVNEATRKARPKPLERGSEPLQPTPPEPERDARDQAPMPPGADEVAPDEVTPDEVAPDEVTPNEVVPDEVGSPHAPHAPPAPGPVDSPADETLIQVRPGRFSDFNASETYPRQFGWKRIAGGAFVVALVGSLIAMYVILYGLQLPTDGTSQPGGSPTPLSAPTQQPSPTQTVSRPTPEPTQPPPSASVNRGPGASGNTTTPAPARSVTTRPTIQPGELKRAEQERRKAEEAARRAEQQQQQQRQDEARQAELHRRSEARRAERLRQEEATRKAAAERRAAAKRREAADRRAAQKALIPLREGRRP